MARYQIKYKNLFLLKYINKKVKRMYERKIQNQIKKVNKKKIIEKIRN